MRTFYKATRPDGTDFYSRTIDYAAAAGSDKRVRCTSRRTRTSYGGAPLPTDYQCCTADVLHAGVTPMDVWAGSSWPLRLFEVTGRPVAEDGGKRGFRSLRVLREVPAHLAFGPQGEHVGALVDRARSLTGEELTRLVAAWDAARGAARDAARDAALGLVVRDLISTEHYDKLTLPWRKTIGPIHPDDPEPS